MRNNIVSVYAFELCLVIEFVIDEQTICIPFRIQFFFHMFPKHESLFTPKHESQTTRKKHDLNLNYFFSIPLNKV